MSAVTGFVASAALAFTPIEAIACTSIDLKTWAPWVRRRDDFLDCRFRVGVRVIPVGLLPYRQGWGSDARPSRSTLGQCANRVSLVRFASRYANEDTFLSVECACGVNELAQRAGQVRNLAPAFIARSYDDREYCGFIPRFRCHRLDPIVCLLAGEGTRQLSTRMENPSCSHGATEHDSNRDRRQNPENNDFRDDPHNPPVLLSEGIIIVINDVALIACSSQYDRARQYSARAEAPQQRSGSSDVDWASAYEFSSVDRASCSDAPQRETVCECQDGGQGYEQTCEHDEHWLHAAPVRHFYVDRVNAFRTLPSACGFDLASLKVAGNVEGIAALGGGMIQFSFQTLHGQGQLEIERVPICRKMRATMAIRADARDISDVVWTPVAQSPDVVSFQVRAATRCGEWGRLTAAFAMTVGSLQHVIPHIAAPLEDCAGGLIDLRARGRARSQCAQSQVGKRGFGFCLTGQVICFKIDFSEGSQAEDYCFPIHTLDVRLGFCFPPRTHEYTVEADSAAFPLLREDEQIFAVLRMVADSTIAGTHFHRPTLALPRVTQAAVGFVLVSISDNASAVPCEDKDAGKSGGGGDASLLLTAVARVDLSPTMVGLMDYEWPVHQRTLHFGTQMRKPGPHAGLRLAA